MQRLQLPIGMFKGDHMKKLSKEDKNMKVAYIYGFSCIVILLILTVINAVTGYKIFEAMGIGLAISMLVFTIVNVIIKGCFKKCVETSLFL